MDDQTKTALTELRAELMDIWTDLERALDRLDDFMEDGCLHRWAPDPADNGYGAQICTLCQKYSESEVQDDELQDGARTIAVFYVDEEGIKDGDDTVVVAWDKKGEFSVEERGVEAHADVPSSSGSTPGDTGVAPDGAFLEHLDRTRGFD